MYKIRYTDEYENLPQKQLQLNLEHPLKPLFVDRLKITKSKWQQLQALKKVLPRDIHCFYNTIKYNDDTDDASDQSPSITNLEVKSKNMVKVAEKTVLFIYYLLLFYIIILINLIIIYINYIIYLSLSIISTAY